MKNKIYWVEGSPWTNRQLALRCGITQQTAANRFNDYQQGKISIEALFTENRNKSWGLFEGMREISRKEWRAKRHHLVSQALKAAALLPAPQRVVS